MRSTTPKPFELRRRSLPSDLTELDFFDRAGRDCLLRETEISESPDRPRGSFTLLVGREGCPMLLDRQQAALVARLLDGWARTGRLPLEEAKS